MNDTQAIQDWLALNSEVEGANDLAQAAIDYLNSL